MQLMNGQVWIGNDGSERLIHRLGVGCAPGREDLWYHYRKPDGSWSLHLRSCFLTQWNRWQRKTQARLEK